MDHPLGTLLASVALLTLPLIVSGSIHMWIVRQNYFAALARPIHKPSFGANKTWRGFAVMMLATVLGVLLARLVALGLPAAAARPFEAVSPLPLGLLLGLGYALAELPNSYLKRRLGIPPGAQSTRHRAWFTFLDQADSAIGCAVVYAALLDYPARVLVLAILLGPAVHLVANVTLYAAGLRKEAF